jgi:Zn-dependent protease with chaperone function
MPGSARLDQRLGPVASGVEQPQFEFELGVGLALGGAGTQLGEQDSGSSQAPPDDGVRLTAASVREAGERQGGVEQAAQALPPPARLSLSLSVVRGSCLRGHLAGDRLDSALDLGRERAALVGSPGVVGPDPVLGSQAALEVLRGGEQVTDGGREGGCEGGHRTGGHRTAGAPPRAPHDDTRTRRSRPPRAPMVAGGRTPPYREAVMRTLILAVVAAALASCVSTPISGRSNIPVLLTATEQVELGADAYEQYLAGGQVVSSGAQAAMVGRAMDRLIGALGADDPGFPWEVRLIRDDSMVNAWCLPGGKMAVYSGILPVAQDETGLAVVMGHEIAHAVAEHGARRLQLSMGKQWALDAIAQWNPELAEYREVADLVVEYGALLPWGREDELEADHIGLVLMARAGYDPRRAVEFWSRMAALGGGNGPAWLSTHPSNAQRIAELEARLPEAVAIYRQTTGLP